MTSSGLALQRRLQCHASGGDKIKLEKKRGGWVRVRIFE